MGDPPQGATHWYSFYGHAHYYRKEERRHLNQVSEEWQTLTAWFKWNTYWGQWEHVGPDFSPRNLKEISS